LVIFERESAVIIKGPKEYTDLIDINVYTAYLRQRGASDDAIAHLKIEFVKSIPGSLLDRVRGLEVHGQFNQRLRCIQIATGVVEEGEDREEAIRELNGTLLHESLHLCEHINLKAKISSIAFRLITVIVWFIVARNGTIVINALPIGIPLQIVLIVALWAIMLIIYPKMLYQISPSERRARKIEKSGIWLLQRPLRKISLPRSPT
jgi:hypothetical protein